MRRIWRRPVLGDENVRKNGTLNGTSTDFFPSTRADSGGGLWPFSCRTQQLCLSRDERSLQGVEASDRSRVCVLDPLESPNGQRCGINTYSSLCRLPVSLPIVESTCDQTFPPQRLPWHQDGGGVSSCDPTKQEDPNTSGRWLHVDDSCQPLLAVLLPLFGCRPQLPLRLLHNL